MYLTLAPPPVHSVLPLPRSACLSYACQSPSLPLRAAGIATAPLAGRCGGRRGHGRVAGCRVIGNYALLSPVSVRVRPYVRPSVRRRNAAVARRGPDRKGGPSPCPCPSPSSTDKRLPPGVRAGPFPPSFLFLPSLLRVCPRVHSKKRGKNVCVSSRMDLDPLNGRRRGREGERRWVASGTPPAARRRARRHADGATDHHPSSFYPFVRSVVRPHGLWFVSEFPFNSAAAAARSVRLPRKSRDLIDQT